MPRTSRPFSAGRWRALPLGLALLLAMLVLATPTSPALAEPVAHGALVREAPEWAPPNFWDGDVRAVVQVGNRVVVGGTFTRVDDGGQSWDQAYLAAYDRFSGELDTSFLPELNGRVRSIADAGGGRVVVGGDFTRIDGTWRTRAAMLDLSDGSVVTSWRANTDVYVNDVAVVGDQVWLTGRFTTVNGTPREKVAVVDLARGDLYPERADLYGNRGYGTTTPEGRSLDVSPDGSRVLLTHTATGVNGRYRPSIATFRTSDRQLTSWGTLHYDGYCQQEVYPLPRDAKYDPTGAFFYVVTAIGNFAGTCDVAVKFPAEETGQWVLPTWISRLFDSPEALAVTDVAVYVGGHFKCGMTQGTTWTDYADGNVLDCRAPGTPHTHLMALRPSDGTVHDWFPDVRSDRGVLALEVVDGALLAGSDGTQWKGRVIGHHALYEVPAAFDDVDPTTVLAAPGPGDVVDVPVGFAGTAADDRGVADVLLAVRDDATNLWLQPDGTWGSWTRRSVPVDDAGATTTPWSLDLDLPAGQYLVTAQARDTAGNVDTSAERARFTVAGGDAAAPTATVAQPADGAAVASPVTLSGTAADDVAVEAVALAVRRNADGTWLQPGGGFGPWTVVEAGLAAPGRPSTGWSLVVDLPDGSYTAWVRATDWLGTHQPAAERPRVRFTVGDPDTAAPVVAIDEPADGAGLAAGPVDLLGTAGDDVGVTRVVVEVRDAATGLWLRDDGSFGAWQHLEAAVASPGAATTGWGKVVDLPPGRYRVYARSFDAAGNRSDRPSVLVDVA